MAYQYCETDPFHSPAQLLQANHRDSCVPTVKHGDWACSESAVVLEYVSLRVSFWAVMLMGICRSRIWAKEPPYFLQIQDRKPIVASGLTM